jgi:hypothetical protein
MTKRSWRLLPSLCLSDAGDIPPATATLSMAPSASTSAAKTQLLQPAGTVPTAPHPNQNLWPRYPFKPAAPSESD